MRQFFAKMGVKSLYGLLIDYLVQCLDVQRIKQIGELESLPLELVGQLLKHVINTYAQEWEILEQKLPLLLINSLVELDLLFCPTTFDIWVAQSSTFLHNVADKCTRLERLAMKCYVDAWGKTNHYNAFGR